MVGGGRGSPQPSGTMAIETSHRPPLSSTLCHDITHVGLLKKAGAQFTEAAIVQSKIVEQVQYKEMTYLSSRGHKKPVGRSRMITDRMSS